MKITNFPPTLDQIKNIQYSDGNDPDLESGDYVISRYDDDPNLFDIYSKDQAEDSDPDPLFTGGAYQVWNYLNKNH